MHRCFLDQAQWNEKAAVELSAGESEHLLRVLRARPGETVEIFDGRGRVAAARLVSGRNGVARLATEPGSLRLVAPEAISIVLIQAVPKQSAMEEIIQKAVELGVTKIIPVTTARTVVKFQGRMPAAPPPRGPERPADNHRERWLKIALAAAKQCQAAWLTEIAPVASLPEAARDARADLKIFGSLDPAALPLKRILGAAPRAATGSIALAVGPEGDFTEDERRLLAEAGFIPANFGERVLRVATAAVFGLSALKYEFQ